MRVNTPQGFSESHGGNTSSTKQQHTHLRRPSNTPQGFTRSDSLQSTRLTIFSSSSGRRFCCHTLRRQSPSVERRCAKPEGAATVRQSCPWWPLLFKQTAIKNSPFSLPFPFRLNENFALRHSAERQSFQEPIAASKRRRRCHG